MKKKYLYTLFILSFILSGLLIKNNLEYNDLIIEYNERTECESCMLYNINSSFGLNGIYKEDFYCVWTKDRTEQEINRTDCHELSHHFIEGNYTHFCKQ